MKNITKVISEKNTKALLSNFFSLLIVQGTNFLIPLLVFPYLIHVLGVSMFGLVSFAQSFIFYWIMFVDFGFNLSTTKEIAIYKDDKESLSAIVMRTFLTKLILLVIVVVSVVTIVFFIPFFSANKDLYLIALTMVFGQALVPIWFFQGLGKMKFVTYINLLSKVILVLLIFLLIKSPKDYAYVLLCYGIGNIIAGIGSIWLMLEHFGLKAKMPASYSFKKEFRKGWYIFLSHFSINICTNSNLFILGFFANQATVGYYSVAEKVVGLSRQLLLTFFQATYPTVCRLMLNGHEALLGFYKKYFIPFSICMLLLSSAIFIFSDIIVWFFVNENVPEIAYAIRAMIFVSVIALANIPAFQTLLVYDHQKSYTVIFIIGSLLNILFNIILAKYFLLTGTIMAVFLTELFISLGLHTILYIKHPKHRLSLHKFGSNR